jgi:hypothetical protein
MGGLPEAGKPQPPTSHLSKYRDHVAHLDMSEAAKDDLLNVVWRIMGNFVDRAFGDDPVQHVHETRARDEKRIPPVVSSGNKHPDSKARLSSAFTSPASGRGKEERT